MTTLLTIIALLTLTGLTIFQIALILGAPLGKFAWGGQHERLPKNLRIASVSSIVLYLIFAAFVASKGGVLRVIPDSQILDIGIWVFTIYFFVGIAMNAISRSKNERNLMTPVAAILAVTFLLVTIS